MLDKALFLLETQDTYAAIEYMQTLGAPVEVVAHYSELVRHLYWQAQDIPQLVVMARAGIQYALSFADPAVRSTGKTIAYNLASFTWPGWNEPGIVLRPADQAAGLDAARVNYRLAKSLDKPDIIRARACWLLGAHYLAIDQLTEARHYFYRAAIYANRTGQHLDEVLLARAYAMLTKKHRAEFVMLVRQLEAQPDGASLVEQLRTAQRVFGLWFEDSSTPPHEEQSDTVARDR